MITGDLGLYGERLAVALGFITLALFLSIGLTCRSFLPLSRFLRITGFTNSKVYQSFFKFHSYLWYGFGLVLFLHILIGFMHTEIPKPGDPYAAIHWAILVFAGSVLISVSATFSNCRTFASFLRLFRGQSVFDSFYKHFYTYHSYFWIILLAALIGHLTASYLHVGFWPQALD